MGTFEVYADKSGEFRWRFLAANGKAVASSGEGYKDKRDCLHGIQIVKDLAPGAKLDDQSAAAK